MGNLQDDLAALRILKRDCVMRGEHEDVVAINWAIATIVTLDAQVGELERRLEEEG